LGLFLAIFYIQQQKAVKWTVVGIQARVVLALVLFFTIPGIYFAGKAVVVGHNRLPNLVQIDGVNKVDDYVRIRSDDEELGHWAYSEADGWVWTRSVFQLAMAEGDGQLVAQMLPQMKETMRFLNDQKSWSLYAGALAGLGKRAELIGFIDYIRNLDPKYADGMARAYGLTAD